MNAPEATSTTPRHSTSTSAPSSSRTSTPSTTISSISGHDTYRATDVNYLLAAFTHTYSTHLHLDSIQTSPRSKPSHMTSQTTSPHPVNDFPPETTIQHPTTAENNTCATHSPNITHSTHYTHIIQNTHNIPQPPTTYTHKGGPDHAKAQAVRVEAQRLSVGSPEEATPPCPEASPRIPHGERPC